jgi:hypothetical protein
MHKSVITREIHYLYGQIFREWIVQKKSENVHSWNGT